MAADLNAVTLVGRLTRDVEVTYTKSGYAVGKLAIAVNRRKKEGDSWVDEASFFDLSLFGKRAEALKSYLSKGTQIAVSGTLRQDRWQAQDGSKKSRVIVEITDLQLLGSSRGGAAGQGQETRSSNSGGDFHPSSASQGASSSSFGSDEFEDDIPF